MPNDSPFAPRTDLRRTARVTGGLYLGLGICGMLGLLVIRPLLFVPGDASATLERLLAENLTARMGVTLEMGLVVTQALAGLWFFRLFRAVDDFAAAAIAGFGLMNAAAVLGSAACLGTALQVARAPLLAGGADVQLLYLLSEGFWRVGNLFFGLWLVPMGWCALRSRWAPAALGWTLMVGGAGYLSSAVVSTVAPEAGLAAGLLVLPATLGEFWMIGHLLFSRVDGAPA